MTNLPGLPFVREAGDGPAVVLLHASASNSGQWRALTGRLDVPALVLYAQHTRAPARALSELLARTLPNARPVEIGGVGHMAPLANPGEVNLLIESFLASLPSEPLSTRDLEGIF